MGVAGIQHLPEQKASVHCATPAADLEVTLQSLQPDGKPAKSTSKNDAGLLLSTEASITTPNIMDFSPWYVVGLISWAGLVSAMGAKNETKDLTQ